MPLASEDVLPNDFSVLGTLDLNHIGRWSFLPNDLLVEGDLIVPHFRIKDVPSTWRITGKKYISVGYKNHTLNEYRMMKADTEYERFIFSRKKILALQKLVEIPELYQEVYYANKKHFLSLLKKL